MRWKEHLVVCLALALVAGVTAAVRYEAPASAADAPVHAPTPTTTPEPTPAPAPGPRTVGPLATLEATPPEPDRARRSGPALDLPAQERRVEAHAAPLLLPPAGPHTRLDLPPLHATSAPPTPPQEALLSELRAWPTDRLGKRVRFAVQKQDLVERWPSYLSRFTPARFLAVRAWPDEVFTWYAPVYDDPAPRLFVRRGSRTAERLESAERYARFELVGVVREVFGGEPWIEIERATPLPGQVGEGTVLMVGRAIELLRQGSVAMALDQLERARAAPLPEHALLELARLEEVAREVVARAEADGR